jgi:deoxyribonuclease V
MKEELSSVWWRLSPQEAIALQRELAQRVRRYRELPSEIRFVAGIDAAYGNGNVWGVAVLLQLPTLRVVEHAVAALPEEFPYVPGLLSFREAPAIIAALQQLRLRPDILLCDGQGIAHPRRLGIAAHIGVLLDIPSIGCAKSLLCGTAAEPPDVFGGTAPVYDRGELIAMAVRTRPHVKPVYVSIGHRVDLSFAVSFVLHCCRGYRLPEPVRLADLLSKKAAQGRLAEEGKIP